MSDLDVVILSSGTPIEVTLFNQTITPLSLSISDFNSFVTGQYVNDAISEHNISPIAHLDIRELISDEVSALSLCDQYLYNNKIDKPLSATSGNVAIFNNDKNVIDSGINKDDIVLLDLSGHIPQNMMPPFYVENVDGIHHHLIKIRTDEYGDNNFIIGVPVIL